MHALEKKPRIWFSRHGRKPHTNTHARAHARARLSPRNQSASCSGTFLSTLLQLRLHRQQQPVTLRTTWAGFKTWLFVYFLNPHLAQKLRSEDVERRCSCQTSVKRTQRGRAGPAARVSVTGEDGRLPLGCLRENIMAVDGRKVTLQYY